MYDDCPSDSNLVKDRQNFIKNNYSERKEFIKYTKKFVKLMVDYSLFTLDVFNRKKGSKLNEPQIEDIVNFNLNFILQQIQDPEFLSIVREETISRYEFSID